MASSDVAGVSLVRPICGLENHIEDTLRSAFELDYPRYEIIFCAAAANDAAVPLVRRLITAYPHVPARLLIGNEAISENPKLNNVCKGWRAAAYDWIVMADSNVLMPPDYIERLLGAWRADTGLVSSPPVGCRADGFWAELECAFLNTYQVRWQYAAAGVGIGFAQGKSMLYRRSRIEQAGGIRLLAAEPAEDAATTKLVRALGLRVCLVDAPFGQPLGHRSAREVWARQLRWARLRHASFKRYYTLEILSGGIGPLLAAAYALWASRLPVGGVVAVAAVWYGAEAALAYAAGWHLTIRSPLTFLLRDALLPVLWIGGWLGRGFVWRGNQMQAAESRGTIYRRVDITRA
ncbi:MAG TPA: ceramide glucosyltransferase [Xanthobacteraceae bacterium]|jgi:ceramide glucosyltransferase